MRLESSKHIIQLNIRYRFKIIEVYAAISAHDEEEIDWLLERYNQIRIRR